MSSEGSSSQEQLTVVDEITSELAAGTETTCSTAPSTPQQHENKDISTEPIEVEATASNNQNKLAIAEAEVEPLVVVSSDSDEMKRAHAKQLIEKYFYRLTDGCGNPNCTNRNCASSGVVESLTPNQAAARAIQLFSEEAPLCGMPATKFVRIATNDEPATVPANVNASVNVTVTASTAAAAAAKAMPESQSTTSTFDAKLTKKNDAYSVSSAELTATNSENQSSPSLPITQSTKPINYQVLSSQIASESSSAADSTGSGSSSEQASNAINASNMNKTRKPMTIESLNYLDEPSLNRLIDHCKKTNTFAPLIRNLGRYFSSRDLLVQSFQKRPTAHIDELLQKAPKDLKKLKKEDFRTLEGDLDKDVDSSCCGMEPVAPSMAAATATAGYRKRNDRDVPRHYTSVDLPSLRRAMNHLLETKSSAFDSLNNAMQSLAMNISVDLRMQKQRDKIEEIITVLVIIFEIIIIGKSDFVDVALPSICQAAAYLPIWAQARLAAIWAEHCKDGLRKLLETLQQLISLQVITGAYHENAYVQDNEIIISATKLMKIIYYASILAGTLESPKLRDEDADAESSLADDEALFIYTGSKKSPITEQIDPLAQELNVNVFDCRQPYIPFEEFYNEPLSDAIEMDNDYLNYKNRQNDKKFSFMLYSFILTPATKTLGLYYDCRIRMYSERRIDNFQTQLVGQPSNPYLKLKVHRDRIIDDALVELEMIAMGNPKDLKKQLVVEFVGEQGIDEGGVSKEFFQLVIEQIFNPDYGMFQIQEETQTVWFNSTSFENEAQFTLIGIVLGLAIYNNIILAVNFPTVVYRKLMGIKGSFADLLDWNPTMYNSLNEMLKYEGADMEDVFMQTFRISYTDVFGNVLTHDLKENGDQIFVNQENKQEFVDLYADYLLNSLNSKKFRAFRRGFQMVTDESPLHLLFRPGEVQLLVTGQKDFDFNELEKATEYEGGYTEKSQIILDFWEIVHALSLESKRKLLEFTTGSDRVPVGGLSRLKLVIARNGSDSDRLPTSHTCYNVLLLPEYTTKEKLEDRLLKAINYSKGFGMI